MTPGGGWVARVRIVPADDGGAAAALPAAAPAAAAAAIGGDGGVVAALAGRSARAPVPISEASLRNLSLGGIQRLLTKRGVPIPAVEQPFQVYVGIAVANGIAVASTAAAAAAAGEAAAAAAAAAGEVGAAASAADGATRPQWRLEIAGGKDGLPWRMEVRPPKEDGYFPSAIIVSPRGPIMTETAVAVAGDGGRERGDGSALRRMTLQYR